MKQILILLITTIIFGCNTKPKTSSRPESKKQAIKQERKKINFIGKDFYKWPGDPLDFEILETLVNDYNNDGQGDTILIERAKGWEDEPGNFQQIRIFIAGMKELMLQNIEGWITTKNLMEYDKDFDKDNLVESDYVIVKRASNDNLLIFAEGYVYASKPGLLSIVNIYNNENPTLIFNDNVELFNLKDYNNDGIKDIATTFWDGYYKDEQKNKYRYKVYLLNGGLTHSEEYSKQLSEEMYQMQ